MNNNSDNKAQRKPFVHYLNRLLATCSLKCLLQLGRACGFIVARTPNQISRMSRANIQRCFSERPAQQCRQLVAQSVVHTCCAFTELAALWHHPLGDILARVDIDYLDPAFSSAAGARIVIAPHHGSWEMLNLWLAQQGDYHAVYKPARSQPLDHYIRHSRERNGATLDPTNTAGMRNLVRALGSGATCMLLPDQRPPRKSAHVTSSFFGQPARTSLLVKKLAARSGADLFIAVMTRDLESARYRLRLESIDPKPLLASDDASAAYLNRCIEGIVSHDLGQYQWSYRRFIGDTYR